jgi:hypothetical protein
LLAVLAEHAVLVVELDELDLLVHDQDRFGEDRAADDAVGALLAAGADVGRVGGAGAVRSKS